MTGGQAVGKAARGKGGMVKQLDACCLSPRMCLPSHRFCSGAMAGTSYSNLKQGAFFSCLKCRNPPSSWIQRKKGILQTTFPFPPPPIKLPSISTTVTGSLSNWPYPGLDSSSHVNFRISKPSHHLRQQPELLNPEGDFCLQQDRLQVWEEDFG